MKPKTFDPVVKHLVYLYTLYLPKLDAEMLHEIWPKHPMLKDFDRPSARTIQRWRNEWNMPPRKVKKKWIKI